MVFFLGLVCLVGGVIAVLPLFTEKHPRLAAFDAKLTPYKIDKEIKREMGGFNMIVSKG